MKFPFLDIIYFTKVEWFSSDKQSDEKYQKHLPCKYEIMLQFQKILVAALLKNPKIDVRKKAINYNSKYFSIIIIYYAFYSRTLFLHQ